MNNFIWNVFGTDSLLGRITSRLWIIFGANIMFLIFSFPIITAGPAYVAMYHVCLKSLRSDDQLNPFVEFWRGFRSNFKQAFLSWLISLAIIVILVLDIMFLAKTQSMVKIFQFPVYIVAGIFLLVQFHYFPVMAAFAATLRGELRNSIFFASKNPPRALLILALNVLPLIWTYYDLKRLPLYAFIWFLVGFGGIAMLVSKLLLKDFEKYLPKQQTAEEIEEEIREKKIAEIRGETVKQIPQSDRKDQP